MNPEEIPEIIICTGNDRVKFEMMAQLIDIGVNKEKISFIEKYHRFYDIEVVDRNTVRVKKDNIVIECDNCIELMISREILAGGIYDYHLNKKYYVLDIGLNMAAAALFFANKNEVVDVYGFEPSTVTFAKAIKNIALNKRIANKIHPYNMGLGKDNRKECYECFDGIDECRGVKKVDELFPQMNGSNKNLIELDIRKSSEILGEIMSLHKKDCVLKMDC